MEIFSDKKHKYMKFFIFITLCLLTVVTILGGAALVSPYYFYSKVLKGNSYENWYESKHFDKRWLSPSKIAPLEKIEDANSNLWQNFHMGDVVIPLPVRNPFYQVLPILNHDNKGNNLFGLSFYGTDKREIAKVFFVQNSQFLNQLNSQGLFKLPMVRQELLTYKQDDLWNELFTKELGEWNISFKEMLKNLYLLELRKSVLPEKFMSFGLMPESDYALVEVESSNKDFNSEFIFTRNRGIIYSMVIYTRKDTPDAQKVRYKLLSGLNFRPTSKSLSNIIYKEFVALSYRLRVDQTGMLYLLSAWSHDPSVNYIKEMIEFLERGEGNELQLKVLYKYAFERYGTTYTTKALDIGDGEVRLRRSIELERKKEERRVKAQAEKKIIQEPTLTKEERLNQMLKRAKKDKSKKSNEVLFD